MRRNPWGISAGADGNVWFTESGANRIGLITPQGDISEFPIPRAGSPAEIVLGADENLWFSWSEGPASLVFALGRVHQSGQVTLFEIPSHMWPGQLTPGPDGAIWFATEFPRIGRFDPAQWRLDEFDLRQDADPIGITTGPDGNIWFTVWLEPIVGQLTPASGAALYHQSPAEWGQGITGGPDGNLWFCTWRPDPGGADPGRIVRMTPEGITADFFLPMPGVPTWITSGPDGNIWFTDQNFGTIGRATPAGAIVDILLPSGAASRPGPITAGPDGNIWFTESGSDRIGRITPTGELTEFSIGRYSGPIKQWNRSAAAIQRARSTVLPSSRDPRRRVWLRPPNWPRTRRRPNGSSSRRP